MWQKLKLNLALTFICSIFLLSYSHSARFYPYFLFTASLFCAFAMHRSKKTSALVGLELWSHVFVRRYATHSAAGVAFWKVLNPLPSVPTYWTVSATLHCCCFSVLFIGNQCSETTCYWGSQTNLLTLIKPGTSL